MPEIDVSIAEALAALLPPHAAFSVCAIPDVPWPERQATQSAVALRCAAEAASRAGAAQPPRSGDGRGPVWPAGFVGSVSHARSVAVAVAAPVRVCVSMGIDIEPTMSFARAERVMEVIACHRERVACGGSPWRLSLLFSAKESVFKCLHPLVDTWFDFDDVEIVRWDDRTHRVWIVLLRDLGAFSRGTELSVCYACVARHVVTSAVLESP